MKTCKSKQVKQITAEITNEQKLWLNRKLSAFYLLTSVANRHLEEFNDFIVKRGLFMPAIKHNFNGIQHKFDMICCEFNKLFISKECRAEFHGNLQMLDEEIDKLLRFEDYEGKNIDTLGKDDKKED